MWLLLNTIDEYIFMIKNIKDEEQIQIIKHADYCSALVYSL